ncbi:splicing factor ESS-2 [Pelomyxa schiedti]|nr:splicing factor ESS-2 [Pelomyxa schiedti]
MSQDLVPVSNTALVLKEESLPVAPSPKKPKVLTENDYVTGMEKIIQRDFFPDNTKLSLGLEYLEAVEADDIGKMRSVEVKLRAASEVRKASSGTPSFTTPSHSLQQTPIREQDTGPCATSSSSFSTSLEGELGGDGDGDGDSEEPVADTNLHLDAYLSKYTSEDNADFEKLSEKASRKRRSKALWLVETKKQNDALLLQGAEKDSVQLLTWPYEPKNQLFYTPSGQPLTAKELEELMTGPQKEIKYSNTRIIGKVHHTKPEESDTEHVYGMVTTSEEQFGERRRKQQEGRQIDLDDLTGKSPKVGGYSFVATPSPAPGDSPLTTWGKIAATPLRLDPTDTPLDTTPGPRFKVPEPPQREKIALALTEKRAQNLRLQTITKPSSPFRMATPSTPSSRFGALSPAGHSLMNRLGKIADPQLRASYSTPIVTTPSLTGRSTPTPFKAPTPQAPTPQVQPTPRSSSAATPNLNPNNKF